MRSSNELALVAASLVASVGIASGIARAAEISEVDALIARGLELRREGKPEEALGFFERAHAAAPSPRTLGQMGLVEAALQRWVDAENHLLAALSSPADPWVTKNRELLGQALALAKEHLGELVVTGPAGTEVAVEGKLVGTLPEVRPLRVPAGAVRVTANGSGSREFSKTVTVQPNARTSLAIVLDPIETRASVALSRPVPIPLAPAPPAAAIEAHPTSSGSGWRTFAGVGLLAAGAGLLTWGIVWMVIDGDDVCGTRTARGCVYDTKTAGTILAGAGTAGLVGGTTLLLVGGGAGDRSVALDLAPNSLFLRGRF